MEKNRGILLNNNGGFLLGLALDNTGKIAKGVVVGDSTKQQKALLLYMQQGELKEAPLKGIGILDMLLDGNISYWETRIKEQLEAEGMKVEKITISTEKIFLNASYSSTT